VAAQAGLGTEIAAARRLVAGTDRTASLVSLKAERTEDVAEDRAATLLTNAAELAGRLPVTLVAGPAPVGAARGPLDADRVAAHARFEARVAAPLASLARENVLRKALDGVALHQSSIGRVALAIAGDVAHLAARDLPDHTAPNEAGIRGVDEAVAAHIAALAPVGPPVSIRIAKEGVARVGKRKQERRVGRNRS
jgi:hypothetical protein